MRASVSATVIARRPSISPASAFDLCLSHFATYVFKVSRHGLFAGKMTGQGDGCTDFGYGDPIAPPAQQHGSEIESFDSRSNPAFRSAPRLPLSRKNAVVALATL